MEELGKRIQRLREAKKFSRDEFADACDVGRQTIFHWEKGTRNPKASHIARMADVLGVSVNFLTHGKEYIEAAGREPEKESLVPVYGKIAATPFRLSEMASALWYVPGTPQDRGAYALQIDGDSMSPLYRPTELIFVRPQELALTPFPPEGDDHAVFIPYERVAHLNNKDVVLSHNEDCSFKRLKIEKGKGIAYVVKIVSLNPKYPTITVRMGDVFTVHGVCYRSEMPR